MPYNQHPLHFVTAELSQTIKGIQTKLKDDLAALGEPDEGFQDMEEESMPTTLWQLWF